MSVTGWGGNMTLTVRVDLSQAVSEIGSPAPSTGSLWNTFNWDTGTWDAGTTWTDVTASVRSLQTGVSLNRQTGQYQTATASFVLDNQSGNYSPDNTASPYRVGASTTIGVLRPVQILVSFTDSGLTTTFSIFTGFIQSWDENFPEFAHDAVVTVDCVGVDSQVSAYNGYAQASQGGSERTDQRIDRVLNNAGFTGNRYLDVGMNTCQATTLASNAMTELRLTADSEGGALWWDGDGAVHFDNQNAIINKAISNTVQATFADDGASSSINYQTIAMSYNGDLVTNIAAYTRVGGTVQVATSAISRQLYGDRLAERTDLICETDAQALALATRQVSLRKEPERRIESLTFMPHGMTSTLAYRNVRQVVASLGLRMLVHVKMTPPAGDVISRYVHVQGISHTITPDKWVVGLQFSSATVWASLFTSKLAITSAPLTATSSTSATSAFVVALQDSFGNPVTAPVGGTVVNLSSNSTGTPKFAASSGGASVTTATILAGSSTVTAYYADTKAGTPTITAAGTGLTSGTQVETITAAAAAKLAITSTSFVAAVGSSATNAFVVTLEDSFNNAVNATGGGTVVNLSSNSTGTAKFAASSGGSSVSSVTITAASSTVTAYYADNTAGTPTITAAATALTSGTQVETIGTSSGGNWDTITWDGNAWS